VNEMSWKNIVKWKREGPAQKYGENPIRRTSYHIEHMLKELVLDMKNAKTLDEAKEIVAVYEGHTKKTIGLLQEYGEYSLREKDISLDAKEVMGQQLGASQRAKE
tara:strand:- start:186 stop:500 length:315 start_codon:yes stop_codon:yes gene_type:complete